MCVLGGRHGGRRQQPYLLLWSDNWRGVGPALQLLPLRPLRVSLLCPPAAGGRALHAAGGHHREPLLRVPCAGEEGQGGGVGWAGRRWQGR